MSNVPAIDGPSSTPSRRIFRWSFSTVRRSVKMPSARVAVVEHRVEQGQGADPVSPVWCRYASVIAVRAPPRHSPAMSTVSAPVISWTTSSAAPGPLEEVVAHRHVGHLRGRVPIADREHGPAVLHRPLDEAAPGCEIHHVVLVDPRRAARIGGSVHLSVCGCARAAPSGRCGTRPGRGGGEVAADLEERGVDLAGSALVVDADRRRSFGRPWPGSTPAAVVGELHGRGIG